ncbi:hypothetical protein CAEBREN_11781 [Caenorhabditis brenneri]|uniref:Uncharacterized protein n=1 Tax=Caenorhabditis brenneri TaxID=135651 RepID=G0PHI2_CAEBE|nr:hypothetical protein CAEBREN_11781 [Caenorhabditis brenneri]
MSEEARNYIPTEEELVDSLQKAIRKCYKSREIRKKRTKISSRRIVSFKSWSRTFMVSFGYPAQTIDEQFSGGFGSWENDSLLMDDSTPTTPAKADGVRCKKTSADQTMHIPTMPSSYGRTCPKGLVWFNYFMIDTRFFRPVTKGYRSVIDRSVIFLWVFCLSK